MAWSKLSRHERGYGTAWDRLRDTILKRDGYLCQMCKVAKRVTSANHVDHIKPKADGGTDDPDNLQALCKACHADKTAGEGAIGRGGKARQRIRFTDDGNVIWD